MSHVEELMKQWEKPEEKPVETPAPEEKPEEKPEDKPVETPASEDKPEDKPAEKPVETPASEDKPEDKPEDKQDPKPKEKPDLSGITPEEKAQHAFRRQLGKQASKYEAIIADMNSKFESVTKELAEIKKQKAEEPLKTRKDFPIEEGGDDEYINYLVNRGVDKKLAEQFAKDSAARAEQEKKDRETRELQEQMRQVTENFYSNCRNAFKDGEYDGFYKTLKKAEDNGLSEMLDEAPAVRDYIFQEPEGPVVLKEMLENKEAFVRIMSRGGNPMAAIIEMHDMARELREKSRRQPEEPPRTQMPSIGKPGAKQAGHAATMWESDEALIDFVRKRK